MSLLPISPRKRRRREKGGGWGRVWSHHPLISGPYKKKRKKGNVWASDAVLLAISLFVEKKRGGEKGRRMRCRPCIQACGKKRGRRDLFLSQRGGREEDGGSLTSVREKKKERCRSNLESYREKKEEKGERHAVHLAADKLHAAERRKRGEGKRCCNVAVSLHKKGEGASIVAATPSFECTTRGKWRKSPSCDDIRAATRERRKGGFRVWAGGGGEAGGK